MNSVRTTIGGLGNLMFKQAYIADKMLKGEIPDLYVQSDKYWKDNAATIKSMFSEGIGFTDKVSLHLRRGDYKENPFYVDLWKTDYYQKAIAMFPDEKFLVFCRDNQSWDTDKEDRQWCRDNLTPLLGDRWELAPRENTEWEDMNLMSSCKAHIGANSSFSWWACYLGSGPKIMPANDKWYSDGVERTECPETWTRL